MNKAFLDLSNHILNLFLNFERLKLIYSVMKKRLLGFIPSVLLLFLFGSNASGQYCNATYSTLCSSGDFINNFVLNTISNTGTGCPGTANSYSNFTSIQTDLVATVPYAVSASSGPSWGQSHAVFIDFNQDNDFADAGEFFNLGYAPAGGTINGSITVPVTAL